MSWSTTAARVACLSMLASAALSGCADTTAQTSGEESITASASPGPPARFTQKQLSAALPFSREELKGLWVRDDCRVPRKACRKIGADPGEVAVTATGKRHRDELLLYVAAMPRYTERLWIRRDRTCEPGRIRKPIEAIKGEPTRYRAAERGWMKYDKWSHRGWDGFVCTGSVTFINSRHEVWKTIPIHYIHLHYGEEAILRAKGRTARETKALVKEYLDRLATVSG